MQLDNIFEICVSGFETYSPIWLRKDCTKEEFEADTKEALSEAIKELVSKGEFIQGSDLQNIVIAILKKQGYETVNPLSVVNLNGECLYNEHFARPDLISDEEWNAILKNNEKVHEQMHNDFLEREKNENT